MRNSISIIGYYTSNFGDLLMLRGIIRTLSSNYKYLFILTYGNLSLVEIGDVGVSKERVVIINIASKLKSSLSLLCALFTSRTIIWGGGTCFNSKEKSYGGLRYMRLFHKFGVSVRYIGVGINTNKIDDYLSKSIKELFSLSERFMVRDKESLEYIRREVDSSFDCLVPDPIFLNNFAIKGVKNQEKLLFCSYRCVDSYFCNASEYREQFIDNLLYLLCRYRIDRVLIYPSDHMVDLLDNKYIAERLIENCHNNVVVDFMDSLTVDEVLTFIESSWAVITGRLHIGVVSALFRKPFQLLNYSSKNRAFVNDYGFNEKCLVEYSSLSDETMLSSNILELVNNFTLPASFPPSTKSLIVDMASL